MWRLALQGCYCRLLCIWSSLFLNKVRLGTFAYQKMQTVNGQLQAESIRQQA